MGARTKLNAVCLGGCLAAAAAIGLAAQSWLLFMLTLAASVASSLHSGGIRNRPAVEQRPRVRRTRKGR